MRFTVDELNDILGDTSWEFFEGRHTGDLFVRVDDGFGLLGFYMRIGTHFKLPTQVIVADGSFIRMRSAKQYADYPLIEINAKEPEACVYPDQGGSSGTKPIWMPWLSYTQVSGLMNVASTVTPGIGTFPISGTTGYNPLVNAQVQLYQAQLQQAAQQYAPNQGLGLGHVPQLPRVK